jgi:hypothetical protein
MSECDSTIEITKGQYIKIADSLSDIEYSESIQDLKNSITLIDDNDKKTYVVASASDSKSISNYGLLGQIESIDKDDKTSKSIIAKNMLAELNKITTSIKVTLLGSDLFKKGSILALDYPEYGVSGNYYAKNTSHAVKNKIHIVNAELILV